MPERGAIGCAGPGAAHAGRRGATHLPLGRLDEDHVAEMVRTCLPGAGLDVVARVQQAADGVPFLVEEVLASPGVPGSFADTIRVRLAVC